MRETEYTYQIIKGILPSFTLKQLLHAYETLFDDAQPGFFIQRIEEKENVLSILCFKNDSLVGFKVGYQYDDQTFYSWVGGVLPSYRKQGIAQRLMELQHQSAAKSGYQKVRTKSMNRFKPMLILNLKNGFDIVQMYTNESGQTKIVFEKEIK